MVKDNDNEEYQALGDVLKQFVKQNHLQKGLDNANIKEVWNAQMGPAIQKYTTNIRLKNETLYVNLSSSVLREELSYGRSKIIKNLNEAVGKEIIKTLILR